MVGAGGMRRTLAKIGARTAVAANGDRLVLFTSSAMHELNLAQTGSPAIVTKLDDRDPVQKVDVDADGARVLFATAKHVYLRAGAEVKAPAEIAGVHSLSFSPDGASQVWLGDAGGAVTVNGKPKQLPPGTRSAHFRTDGGTGLVLTTEEGVFSWEPADAAPKLVGGVSPDDGVNITGEMVGDTAISFAYLKSGHQKEMQAPTTPFP